MRRQRRSSFKELVLLIPLTSLLGSLFLLWPLLRIVDQASLVSEAEITFANNPKNIDPKNKCPTNVADLNSNNIWQSSLVYCKDGQLHYAKNKRGSRRIPDFGKVGYKYGSDLPRQVPVVHTISPVKGDNTRHIQTAIDYVAAEFPLNNGVRGVLFMSPGIYTTDDVIHLSHDGVILRGSGSGNDPTTDTIIQSSRSGQDGTVLFVGNDNVSPPYSQFWDAGNNETQRVAAITDSFIPIGQRSFTVSNSQIFQVGDLVVIQQQLNDAWYKAVHDGGTKRAPGWRERSFPWMDLSFARFVTHLDGNQITVDAPLYYQLNRNNGALIMFKHDDSAPQDTLYRNVGVEQLRISIETLGGVDTNHTRRGIEMVGVIDGWINDVSILHFSMDGIRIQKSTRITVQDTSVGPPIAPDTGGYRYGFQPSGGAQQILFKNCRAIGTRHGFIPNGSTRSSGFVFYQGKLVDNLAASEGGHRQWSMGTLFDGCTVVSGNASVAFLLGNRGDWGTSHGWGAVNSVLWNTDTGGHGSIGHGSIVIQKPPTAMNYAIGCSGDIGSDGRWPGRRGFIEGSNIGSDGSWPGRRGFIEGSNKDKSLFPFSLYDAQVLAWKSSE